MLHFLFSVFFPLLFSLLKRGKKYTIFFFNIKYNKLTQHVMMMLGAHDGRYDWAEYERLTKRVQRFSYIAIAKEIVFSLHRKTILFSLIKTVVGSRLINIMVPFLVTCFNDKYQQLSTTSTTSTLSNEEGDGTTNKLFSITHWSPWIAVGVSILWDMFLRYAAAFRDQISR
jgi:hypothetical protein